MIVMTARKFSSPRSTNNMSIMTFINNKWTIILQIARSSSYDFLKTLCITII